ncbi:MAG: sigma-70 family RNA polymerase sigma factor [Deltaproteobacteria bacterium]|nr:sigma-70 family RNA polymerase sigma factor [Deltaproteobacteria bacterium]
METAAWVERARRGDERAREALFRAYAPVAMRVALGMTSGRTADAEDLLQDAWLACFARLDDLREPAAFGGFLMKTVKNLGINRWHKAARHERGTEKLAAEPAARSADDPFAVFAAAERQEIVRRAIAALADGPLKETARLYYVEGLDSTGAVATRLGVPQSTVTTRLDRVRDNIKKALVVELSRRVPASCDRQPLEEALR